MTSSYQIGGAAGVSSMRWRLYRAAWSLCFGFLILVGISVTATALSPATLVGVTLAISLPTAASVAAWSMVSLVPRPVAVAVMTGVWATVLVLTAYGLVLAFGAWALLWLLALVIGSPTAVRLARLLARPLRGSSVIAGAGPGSRDPSFDDAHTPRLLDPQCPEGRRPALTTLSFGDLGAIWRMSGNWLAEGLSMEETTHLVRLREACLDEMERRDPQGFGTWFPLARPADAADFGATSKHDPPSRGEGAT